MTRVVAEEELYRSCRLIFGNNLKVSQEFLKYLQLSGIKKAYRQKALELHPDVSCSQSHPLQQVKTARFIDVHKAYENLIAYLDARDKGFCISPIDSVSEDLDGILSAGKEKHKSIRKHKKKDGISTPILAVPLFL